MEYELHQEIKYPNFTLLFKISSLDLFRLVALIYSFEYIQVSFLILMCYQYHHHGQCLLLILMLAVAIL